MPTQLSLLDPCPEVRFAVLAEHAARLAPKGRRYDPDIEPDRTADAFSEKGKARRRQIAREMAAEGRSLSDYARRLGVVGSVAAKWARTYAPDEFEVLRSATHPNVLTSPQRLARLRAVEAGIYAGIPMRTIAHALGISGNRLRVWLQTWAPFGIDEAIELEECGEDEAEHAERELEAA